MSVKIRLARHGAKKAPFYRIVVADERSRRNGRYLELVGRYDPRTSPSTIEVDIPTVDSWLAKGAQPTEAAAKLIAAARGDKEAPVKSEKISKRARAKAEAEDEEGAAVEEEALPPAPEEEALPPATEAENVADEYVADAAIDAPEVPEETIEEEAIQETAEDAPAIEESVIYEPDFENVVVTEEADS